MRLTRRQWILGSLLTTGLALPGCGSGGVEQRTIKSNQPVGLELAKNLLQGYAEGKPVGSEIGGFPQIVEDAKQQDPAKAEILARGFAEIQQLMNKPAALPAKAKEILTELQE